MDFPQHWTGIWPGGLRVPRSPSSSRMFDALEIGFVDGVGSGTLTKVRIVPAHRRVAGGNGRPKIAEKLSRPNENKEAAPQLRRTASQ